MLQSENLYLHIHPLPAHKCQPLHLWFASIADQPFSLLLDSAGSQTEANQFSLMMWAPELVVTHSDGRTVVVDCKRSQKTFSHDDPIATLDHLFADFAQSIQPVYAADSKENALPFQTGIAGLMGYDLCRYYESIPTEKTGHHTPDMAVGFYTQSIVFCHHTQQYFYFYVSTSSLTDNTFIERLPSLSHQPSPFALASAWQANLTREEYAQALARIQDYLVAGDCYQTNMSQQFTANYTGSEYPAYLALREANKAPFSAFMKTEQGAVISVSPERFLSVRNGKVETKPIKGTRPRSNDPQLDAEAAKQLLNAEKDRAENLMIVDLLRNDLSKHCKPGSVTVPHLFALESYEAVHHMVSTVEGKLDEHSSPLTLLKDAFPGGSITGAPKVRAMEIIDELEPHKRNIYCGSIFYNGWRKDMDSSICIRTLLAEYGSLYCCAGGGIVLDSQADAEYQETLDKVAKILPVLERYGQN